MGAATKRQQISQEDVNELLRRINNGAQKVNELVEKVRERPRPTQSDSDSTGR